MREFLCACEREGAFLTTTPHILTNSPEIGVTSPQLRSLQPLNGLSGWLHYETKDHQKTSMKPVKQGPGTATVYWHSCGCKPHSKHSYVCSLWTKLMLHCGLFRIPSFTFEDKTEAFMSGCLVTQRIQATMPQLMAPRRTMMSCIHTSYQGFCCSSPPLL